MPKVHKLADPASLANEGLLTGRPIVTAHSWCTIEASQFLQLKFRELVNKFTEYLRESRLKNTILTGSRDLLEYLRKFHVEKEKDYCFVTFDFKDLYTNILYEDASRSLHEISMLLGLESGRVEFYLDLYKFCNDWNYFNIGDDIFKQDKGVSMGCYFSKEISELVLLYSEYKYQLITEMSNVEFLGRFADDGLFVFSTCEDLFIVQEMKKLMLFYPSNLIINVTVNRAICIFLDLNLALDDISETYGKIHFFTFFKRFHTFSYLDPISNHPPFVFRGLIIIETLYYPRIIQIL